MTDMLATIIQRKREAEQLFAAAAFLNPDRAREQAGWLEPNYIYDDDVRKFWTELRQTGDAPNAAIAVSLEYFGDIASQASGAYYGIGLSEYANRINQEHWFYAVGTRLSKLAKALADGDIQAAQQVITEISKNTPKTADHIPNAEEVGLDFISDINADEPPTLFTFTPLDRALGGLWKATLTILCARPSIGKTAFGWQLARNIARTHRVLFVSAEMSKRNLWARAVCGTVRIAYRDVQARRVDDKQMELLVEANNNLVQTYGERLLIDDKPNTTADIWRKVATARPEFVVVDHIRLLKDKNINEIQRLGQITEALKDIAKEFDIPVLALAQLNRNPETRDDKRPTMSDLRDSGQIEENADFILGLHRDRQYLDHQMEKSPAQLIVMKFRDGPSEILINLTFDGLGQWFEEVKK